MTRVNFIGAPEFYNLNAACLLVTEAFRNISYGVFHVGSSIERRDYRDVDVRCIMADDDFERFFAAKRGGWSNALWSLICTSISSWLKERTGLPIDFQIQSMTEANTDYPNGHRNALGLFVPRHQLAHVTEPVPERPLPPPDPKYDELRARLYSIEGNDSPWPLKEVLQRLADAADHLLGEHSCDAHGYEGVGYARDAARRILLVLDAPQQGTQDGPP
jgi:hypothetical protein